MIHLLDVWDYLSWWGNVSSRIDSRVCSTMKVALLCFVSSEEARHTLSLLAHFEREQMERGRESRRRKLGGRELFSQSEEMVDLSQCSIRQERDLGEELWREIRKRHLFTLCVLDRDRVTDFPSLFFILLRPCSGRMERRFELFHGEAQKACRLRRKRCKETKAPQKTLRSEYGHE